MKAGKVFRLLAVLAMLAQLWVSVPSAMQLDMQTAMVSGEHHLAMVEDHAAPYSMPCCQDQQDCHCDSGVCFSHPVMQRHILVPVLAPAHTVAWAPDVLTLPAQISPFYRPPIV